MKISRKYFKELQRKAREGNKRKEILGWVYAMFIPLGIAIICLANSLYQALN